MKYSFQQVTRWALEEIIERNAQPSRFGYTLTKENVAKLVEELSELFETSRALKSAGDKMLSQAIPQTPKRPIGAMQKVTR